MISETADRRIQALTERVEELEMQAAHQERTIDEMSTVIADFHRTVETLKRRVERLDEQVRDAQADIPQLPEPPPPHY